MRKIATFGCCLIGITVLSGQSAPRFALRGGCVLPFETIAPTRDQFEFCDNAGRREGAAPPSLADRLRIDAQNNLCARPDAPVTLRLDDFSSFPQPSSATLKMSRASLAAIIKGRAGRDIGEGTVVRTVGTIDRARVAGCSEPKPGQPAGELVSCNMLLGVQFTEMQLDLRRSGTDEVTACGGVVAKIITHYRPRAWQDIDVRTPVPPVRITGQLFFDDTEPACYDAPGRRAGAVETARGRWEIHPVYAIDVCTASREAACDPDNLSVWLPYHRWVEDQSARTQSTGLSERVACRATSIKWMSESRKAQ